MYGVVKGRDKFRPVAALSNHPVINVGRYHAITVCILRAARIVRKAGSLNMPMMLWGKCWLMRMIDDTSPKSCLLRPIFPLLNLLVILLAPAIGHDISLTS